MGRADAASAVADVAGRMAVAVELSHGYRRGAAPVHDLGVSRLRSLGAPRPIGGCGHRHWRAPRSPMWAVFVAKESFYLRAPNPWRSRATDGRTHRTVLILMRGYEFVAEFPGVNGASRMLNPETHQEAVQAVNERRPEGRAAARENGFSLRTAGMAENRNADAQAT